MVLERYILGPMDHSELDEHYFIDQHVYNCPFCKRRNVKYSVIGCVWFNWDVKKPCYAYLVRCDSCELTSMHLSFEDFAYSTGYGYRFKADVKDIDSKLIYSRPTSFFTLNDDIPRAIRELVSEAEESLQFNLLTGASAALRKAIYTLVKTEKTIVANDDTGRTNYTESIKGLKPRFASVSADLINTLAEVQELASNPVHEEAWETWDGPSLRFLIELTKSILNEMYAIPKATERRKAALASLKQKLNPPKPPEKAT